MRESLADQGFLHRMLTIEGGKFGTSLNNLLPDRQLTRTIVLTGSAQQTLGKNILEMAGGIIGQFGCKQVQLAPCNMRLPTRHPENRANHRATSAPRTLLFTFLIQNMS